MKKDTRHVSNCVANRKTFLLVFGIARVAFGTKRCIRRSDTFPNAIDERLQSLIADMNVDVAVAQDRAAILRCARKAPKRRAFPACGLPAEALLFISDRQCDIGTPDSATDKYLRTQERRTQQGRSDPQEPSQSTHSTAARPSKEVWPSLRDKRKRSTKPWTGEEDVFGHGVSWEGGERKARETKGRIQPPTKLQTLERTAKRLGQKMMETMGWILHTDQKQDPRPHRCKRATGEWSIRRERGRGTWFLRCSTGCGGCCETSDARMQSAWQC